ncbi:hypothetical protein ACSQ67_024626 [Phaseolus vulgaris]
MCRITARQAPPWFSSSAFFLSVTASHHARTTVTGVTPTRIGLYLRLHRSNGPSLHRANSDDRAFNEHRAFNALAPTLVPPLQQYHDSYVNTMSIRNLSFAKKGRGQKVHNGTRRLNGEGICSTRKRFKNNEMMQLLGEKRVRVDKKDSWV